MTQLNVNCPQLRIKSSLNPSIAPAVASHFADFVQKEFESKHCSSVITSSPAVMRGCHVHCGFANITYNGFASKTRPHVFVLVYAVRIFLFRLKAADLSHDCL